MSATAAAPMRTGWSPRNVLAILLAVSAILNLFFIVGAVWTRMHATSGVPTLEQRYRRMATELDLTPQQRAGFDKYVAMMLARSDKMHEQVEPLIAGAWQEIAKPQTDQTQVLKLFDEAGDKRRLYLREGIVQTLDFLSILSPEQRAKFVAITREHRAAWMRPHGQQQ